jgi:hypothetical protein
VLEGYGLCEEGQTPEDLFVDVIEAYQGVEDVADVLEEEPLVGHVETYLCVYVYVCMNACVYEFDELCLGGTDFNIYTHTHTGV